VIAAALAFVAAASAAAGIALLAPEPSGRRRGRTGTRVLRLLALAGARLRVHGGDSRPAARGGAGPADLAARIEAAGRPGGLGVRELTAAKLAGAALAGVLGAALGSVAPGRLGFLMTLAAPVAGFLAPDVWLRRLAAERARRVRRELPVLLDLLRVTVEAGSSLPEALRSVGERAAGPLAAELRATGREVALGVPLADALEGLRGRLPLPEVRALVGALERARRHGSPLADTLTAQARDARSALARRIREEAARAGPKIQLVVALMLVPSVLLLVAAALASALLGQEGEVVPL
jgi:tight adherence protein C